VQISRYEETLQQVQADLERSQDNYRKAHAQLMQNEERLHDLKVGSWLMQFLFPRHEMSEFSICAWVCASVRPKFLWMPPTPLVGIW